MVQEFLTQWVIWFRGDGKYPLELQDRMSYEQRMEAMMKTEQIKKILG